MLARGLTAVTTVTKPFSPIPRSVYTSGRIVAICHMSVMSVVADSDLRLNEIIINGNINIEIKHLIAASYRMTYWYRQVEMSSERHTVKSIICGHPFLQGKVVASGGVVAYERLEYCRCSIYV